MSAENTEHKLEVTIRCNDVSKLIISTYVLRLAIQAFKCCKEAKRIEIDSEHKLSYGGGERKLDFLVTCHSENKEKMIAVEISDDIYRLIGQCVLPLLMKLDTLAIYINKSLSKLLESETHKITLCDKTENELCKDLEKTLSHIDFFRNILKPEYSKLIHVGVIYA